MYDPATEIPPVGLLGPVPRRKQPHIYCDAEIAALLRQASLLLPRDGLRPRVLLICLQSHQPGVWLSYPIPSYYDADLSQGMQLTRFWELE